MPLGRVVIGIDIGKLNVSTKGVSSRKKKKTVRSSAVTTEGVSGIATGFPGPTVLGKGS